MPKAPNCQFKRFSFDFGEKFLPRKRFLALK
jgi:hypothetical protein